MAASKLRIDDKMIKADDIAKVAGIGDRVDERA
jgi:hypothetical protein